MISINEETRFMYISRPEMNYMARSNDKQFSVLAELKQSNN